MPATTAKNMSLPPCVRYDSFGVGEVFFVGPNAYSRLPGNECICVMGDITGNKVVFADATQVLLTKTSSLDYTV